MAQGGTTKGSQQGRRWEGASDLRHPCLAWVSAHPERRWPETRGEGGPGPHGGDLWSAALMCLTCSPFLPQAWAVFKGKFKEGDKAEPATWKTRLRCALNKSPDFEEVTDRSQLDISEPYKVYRIVPEEEQKCNYRLRALRLPGAARSAASQRARVWGGRGHHRVWAHGFS